MWPAGSRGHDFEYSGILRPVSWRARRALVTPTFRRRFRGADAKIKTSRCSAVGAGPRKKNPRKAARRGFGGGMGALGIVRDDERGTNGTCREKRTMCTGPSTRPRPFRLPDILLQRTAVLLNLSCSGQQQAGHGFGLSVRINVQRSRSDTSYGHHGEAPSYGRVHGDGWCLGILG